MVVGKYSSDNNHNGKYNTKVEIIIRWFLISTSLNPISDETENGTKPKQERKATKKILAELDPFRSCRRWGESVFAVFVQIHLSLPLGQSIDKVGVESGEEFLELDFVYVKLELLL